MRKQNSSVNDLEGGESELRPQANNESLSSEEGRSES